MSEHHFHCLKCGVVLNGNEEKSRICSSCKKPCELCKFEDLKYLIAL